MDAVTAMEFTANCYWLTESATSSRNFCDCWQYMYRAGCRPSEPELQSLEASWWKLTPEGPTEVHQNQTLDRRKKIKTYIRLLII